MYPRRKHSPEHASSGMPRILNAALVFVVMVALAACTDQPATEDEFAADTAGAMTQDTTDMMAGATQADTIQVELVAMEIDMPSSIQAGSHVFEVENVGETEHGFEIEAEGGEEWAIESLPPGETQTLTADLQEGTYTVYCPVDNHREQGMEMTLTVESSNNTAGLDGAAGDDNAAGAY